MEFFFDSRVRNVWAENADRDALNEVDVRAGLRTSWDTFFRWSPKGTIFGTVFKDFNANSIKDKGEPGIEGIKIKVGKKTVVTNSIGDYYSFVRAKKIKVSLDSDSIPRGYVLSTILSKDIVIEHKKTAVVDFGLTSRSGIYGVVYYDKNENNELDPDDILIPKARVALDEKLVVESSYDGSYFFENITPGKHSIKLEINSLPIEYLPLIKLVNEVDVEEGTTYVFHVPLTKKTKKK
jgi:hypothetical protein